MLTLSLLRHGKAVAHGYGDDFTRELADRGKADSLRLGTYLAERHQVPDFALVSASERTTQTFVILETSARAKIPVQYEQMLYNAMPGQMLDALKLIEPSVKHLMMVGHNPGIMELGIILARDGDLLDLERLRTRFPPGAMATLTFQTEDWSEARVIGGRLDSLLLPEDLVAPDAPV